MANIFKDFSQHGEGRWLFDYIGRPSKGRFADIGAHDGITNSNSNIFAQAGWEVVYFEPNPVTFSRLFSNTKQFRREMYNIAISDGQIKKSKFEIVTKQNYEGHSKLTENGTHTVLCLPFGAIYDGTPDIVSIDAEGHDTAIATSIFSEGIFPKYIIIESNSQIEREKQYSLFTANNYRIIKEIKVNTIWERQ